MRYGKILSIPDTMILKYFEFCTDITESELLDYKTQLESNEINPRDTKRKLARDVVSIYHGSEAASEAEENFDKLFIKKDIPDNIPEYALTEPAKLIDIMVSNNMVSSNGEARRMIKQGAVKLDNEKVDDGFIQIDPGTNVTLKVGKRRFLKIT